jgi:hypothetical protein
MPCKRTTNKVVTAEHTIKSLPMKRGANADETLSTPTSPKRASGGEATPQAELEDIPELPKWRDSIRTDSVPPSIASADPGLASMYLPEGDLPEDLYGVLGDVDKDREIAARSFVACSQKVPAFGKYFDRHPPPTNWGQNRSGLESIVLETSFYGNASLSAFYCGVCYSPDTVHAALGAADAVRKRRFSKNAAETWRTALKNFKEVIIENPFDADLHLECEMHKTGLKERASREVTNIGAAVPAPSEMAEQVRAYHKAVEANTAAVFGLAKDLGEFKTFFERAAKALTSVEGLLKK